MIAASVKKRVRSGGGGALRHQATRWRRGKEKNQFP